MGEVQFSDAYSNEYQVRPVVEEVLESLYILHLSKDHKGILGRRRKDLTEGRRDMIVLLQLLLLKMLKTCHRMTIIIVLSKSVVKSLLVLVLLLEHRIIVYSLLISSVHAFTCHQV